MWFIEDPWPPIMILAVLALVFGIAWNATHRGLYLLTSLGLVALGFVVLIVEELIVTEAEVVEARVHALAESVTRGDDEKVLSFLADDADNLRAEIGSRMKDVQVQGNLRITDLRVTLDSAGTQAVSHFRANGTVSYRKTLNQTGPTRWNLTWQKTGETWKIIQIERRDPIKGEVIGTWSHL